MGTHIITGHAPTSAILCAVRGIYIYGGAEGLTRSCKAPATKGVPKQRGYKMSLASYVGLGDMPVHLAGRAKCSPSWMHRWGGWPSAILLREMGWEGAHLKKLKIMLILLSERAAGEEKFLASNDQS